MVLKLDSVVYYILHKWEVQKSIKNQTGAYQRTPKLLELLDTQV